MYDAYTNGDGGVEIIDPAYNPPKVLATYRERTEASFKSMSNKLWVKARDTDAVMATWDIIQPASGMWRKLPKLTLKHW